MSAERFTAGIVASGPVPGKPHREFGFFIARSADDFSARATLPQERLNIRVCGLSKIIYGEVL